MSKKKKTYKEREKEERELRLNGKTAPLWGIAHSPEDIFEAIERARRAKKADDI